MKHLSLFRAMLAILVASGFQAGAALENRADSLGTLERYDPNEPSPEFIVKIHGDPRKGLPETAGHRVQRVSDTTWYLEMGKRIARAEPDYRSGEVTIREVLGAAGEWVVSPDGKLIFATRQQAGGIEVSECFDLENGESKWTFEKGMSVMDACFTPDGKQVVILHSLSKPAASDQAAVSWYDAVSGEMTRRVDVPGEGFGRGDFLSFSRNFLYVVRPSDRGPAECMFIKDGATEPIKVDAGTAGQDEEPVVRVGGKYGEFVVFLSGRHAVLFQRDKEGALTQIQEVELEGTPEGNPFSWCARFTPDGNHLVLSSCLKTIFIPTRNSGKAQLKEFPGGSHLADFSLDGIHFATFDNGGGRIRKTLSWEKVESFETRMRPPHCCPITEAGFSISGNYIISCDDVRLLLWSKDGQQIAELYSARSDTNGAVKMQSPVVVEEQGKIYGADGYDFLVWDLESLHKRLSRKPDNVPRVKGEIVFRDRVRQNTEPEVMNIRVDAKGEHIITATRSNVRYRPLAASDPVVVPVPQYIFMKPRTFMDTIAPSTVIVRSGSDAFSLDLTGKDAPVTVAQDAIGLYSANGQTFAITSSGGSESTILSRPVGNIRDTAVQSTRLVTLPAGWHLRPEFGALSHDGRWLFVVPTVWGKGSVVAAVDLTKREIVRSQPVSWTATSLALSKNGTRLLVGSTNRAVYEFDILKMTVQQ